MAKVRYYRFESGGKGIYEAVDLACPRNDSRRAGKPDGSWLPRVGEKYSGGTSFWTRAGLDKYQSSGLRGWHESVLTYPVDIQMAGELEDEAVFYRDPLQVICKRPSHHGFKLRTAVPDDAPGIASVKVQAWREAYAGIVDEAFLAGLSEDKAKEAWSKTLTGKDSIFGQSSVKVVEDGNGQIIGYASGGKSRDEIPGHDCEVYAIYLLKKHKGAGIGALLFNELLHALRGRGFSDVGLWVLQDNPTRSFYERMGGKVLAGTKPFRLGGQELIEVAYGWSFK